MSEQKPKRFDALNAIRKGASVPTASAGTEAIEPAGALPHPYSTYLVPLTKRRLKQAAAKEGRKQFEVVEQAVLEFLDRYHPDIQ
jgi:hypothetical protein